MMGELGALISLTIHLTWKYLEYQNISQDNIKESESQFGITNWDYSPPFPFSLLWGKGCFSFMCSCHTFLMRLRWLPKMIFITAFPWDFLHWQSHHLQTKTVLFFLSQLVFLLFPFLIALARTFRWCWVGAVRADTLALFPIKWESA